MLYISKSQLFGKYWLLSYETTRRSGFSTGFHNTGQPHYWQQPNWLKDCKDSQHFKTKNGFYYCMILSGHLQRAGIHINFPKNISAGGMKVLDISFFGPLIGSGSHYLNSDGYALWSDIRMNLLCDNTWIEFQLPDIGLDWRLRNNKRQGNELLAPLQFRVHLKCKKERIKTVQLTFRHVHKGKIRGRKKDYLEWKLMLILRWHLV